VSFHAPWCSACRKLDQRTLRHPSVASELERFVRVRVDTSEPGSRPTMQRFGVWGVPVLILLDSGGSAQEQLRSVGFVDVETLLARLEEMPEGRETLTRRPGG
jgi:thiol:disulfide interchange protein DsbD